MTSIVKQDIAQLIDGWLEQESKGVQFPVPFDLAWQIAGYSRKDSAKRKLSKLSQGNDFHTSVENSGGRPRDIISLTCDAMKHLCLMAETSEGYQIRQYFIEAEKKWRLVKENYPEVASAVEATETLRLQLELERERNLGKRLDSEMRAKREFILDTRGPQILALIEGRPDAVVEKIEKVTETIVCRDGRNVSFEGKSTAELGKELGFKSGKELERWLTKQNCQGLICEGLRAVQAPYIPSEYIPEVKRLWSLARKSAGTQLFLGE